MENEHIGGTEAGRSRRAPFPFDGLAHPAHVTLEDGPPEPLIRFDWWAAGDELTLDRLALVDEISVSKLDRPEGALRDFMRLARASEADAPKQALRLARRYGELRLCKHEVLGAFHWQPVRNEQGEETLKLLYCKPLSAEPVRVWVRYAREATAMVRIGRVLREGRCANPADWQVLIESGRTWPEWRGWEFRIPFTDDAVPPWVADMRAAVGNVAAERRALVGMVNAWCEQTETKPHLRWLDGDDPQIIQGGRFLSNAVTLELLGAVCAASLLLCESCGASYDRQRAPAAGRRVLCQSCAQRAAREKDNLRQREKYAKNPEAVRSRVRERRQATRKVGR